MSLTQRAVDEFYERIKGMSEQQIAEALIGSLNDRELLLDIRQARLAEVAAIEKKLGISPSTAECRRIARGKCNPKGVQSG